MVVLVAELVVLAVLTLMVLEIFLVIYSQVLAVVKLEQWALGEKIYKYKSHCLLKKLFSV